MGCEKVLLQEIKTLVDKASHYYRVIHCVLVVTMCSSCFILCIGIILSVSSWVLVSFFPFIQACFIFFFKLWQVDSVHGILGLGDLWAGGLPLSSTSSESSVSLFSLSSCSLSSSGSLFPILLSDVLPELSSSPKTFLLAGQPAGFLVSCSCFNNCHAFSLSFCSRYHSPS